MKKIKFYISALLLVAVSAMSLSSCSEDKLGDTIFPDVDESLDPTSYTYKLDKFLKENYLEKYNLTFLYKMPDVSTNMNYNLVPATYENSIDLAVLCKHLWFDVYDKVAGPDFLKTYGPRIILLIGSPAYNPTSGTEIVGLAEGGIKISLFKVNAMRISDFYMMNEYYFKTMHHEFAHILHQTKTYPNEFNTISIGHYDSNNWQDRSEGQVASLGFVTTYASSEFREDFAETIANYIVQTDDQWNRILDLASRGWTSGNEDDVTSEFFCYYYYPDNDATKDPVYVYEFNVWTEVDDDGTIHKYWRNNTDPDGNRIVVYDVEDKDGIDGREAILHKVDIAREWLKTAWNVDLDELRNEVQTRQATYNINELRKLVTEIQ
ncbi:MAG: substrate import-associated zinc metallohydrolase lipoprotein [Bacteroidales bacterium]|nr:substrate import-associated zinc metallohydrolase lipoprotein [Bacteroidales bacterium]